MINVSERASEQVKTILIEKNVPVGYGLRVGVTGGGCSGLSYALGFDQKRDQDEVFAVDGLDIYIDRRHLMYLAGTEIDFQDGLNGRGFTFNNPNATKTCGCGSSFSA